MTTNARKLKIKIDVKENQAAQRKKGEFQYSHSVARVGTGDQITWFSNDGEFTLNFQQGSPFKNLQISSHPAAGNKHETDAMTIEERPAPARYHYTVVITTTDASGQKEVFIDSCPAVLDEC